MRETMLTVLQWLVWTAAMGFIAMAVLTLLDDLIADVWTWCARERAYRSTTAAPRQRPAREPRTSKEER